MYTATAQVRRHPSFSDVLQARAAERPDALAYRFLVDGDGQELKLTYGQLCRRVRAVAAALRARNLTGERAVLLYPPGLDFVVAILGCFSAGVVAVPAYPPRASQSRANGRIAAILDDAQPGAVLTVGRQLPGVTDSLGNRTVACIATDAIEDARADEWKDPGIAGTDLALLQYTSGSTGSPKGVMLTHANLIHNCELVREAFGNTPASAVITWLPPYHDMGLMGGLLQPLYAGCPSTIMAPAAFLQRPARWLCAISRYRGTASGGPNFAFDLCAKTITPQERSTLDLSSWEVAFNGAEFIDPATLDRFATAFADCGFRRDAMYPCYGLAESTLMVSGGAPLRPAVLGLPLTEAGSEAAGGGGAAVGCGRARSGGVIEIVNPASCDRSPAGAVGEIWVAGGSVAKGYWNRPEQTTQTFGARLAGSDEGPFLRTGDLGFVRDGELFVTGRIKDLINIRGIKHYPTDIERTTQESHPALRPGGAAAFSIRLDGQERLVVLQELERSHRNADPKQVIDAIKQSVIDQHELECHAVLLLRPGQLPKTSSGKVQRFVCRDMYIAGEFEAIAEWVAPHAHHSPNGPAAADSETPLEEWLTDRLATTVGMAPAEIDPTEPFMRYGVDSLKAVTLTGEISTRLGRELSATLFWDYPSVSALAQHLSGLKAAG